MAGIFRQTALDRASSPERLDETISIVSVRSWLLLLGLALVIAAGVLWGWFGSVPTRVYGQAIIISEGSSTHALKPLFAGRVVEVLAAPATPVKRGDGLLRMRIPSLEQELQAAEELLATLENAAERMQVDADEADQLDRLAQQVTEQNAKVKVLHDRMQEADTIESPIDGIVEEVDVGVGSVVAEGQVLMTIRTRSTAVEALGFIPAVQGRRILPGMAAHFAPAGVKEDEFGTIRGKVQTVSDHPVSKQAVTEVLHDDALVAAFFEDGSPIEVRIVLETGPRGPGGLVWGAGEGPAFAVTAGTLGRVSVTVREQPPVTLVLPALKGADRPSGS